MLVTRYFMVFFCCMLPFTHLPIYSFIIMLYSIFGIYWEYITSSINMLQALLLVALLYSSTNTQTPSILGLCRVFVHTAYGRGRCLTSFMLLLLLLVLVLYADNISYLKVIMFFAVCCLLLPILNILIIFKLFIT